MHRKLPDPVVLPYPHHRTHEPLASCRSGFRDDANRSNHASADEKAGLLNHYCGPGQTDCPTLSDDYAMEVGLAGSIQ